MKLFTKSLSIYLLPLIGLIFYSCIDDPVHPDGNMITGTIYDRYDKAIVNRNNPIFLSIGNAPVSIIDNSSEFSINSFSVPYDFVLNQYSDKVIYKYEGIKISNTNPVFFRPTTINEPHWYGYFETVVRLPFSKLSRTFYLKVISEDVFFQEQYKYELGPGDTLVPVYFYYPEENKNFTGKLIYLEEEITSEYQLEFPKYGIKSLDEVKNNRVEFSESDIAYNPGEIYTTFKNTVPEGTFEYRSQVLVNFEGYYKGSDILMYDGIRNGFKISLPFLPLNSLKYKFVGGYQTGAFYGNAFKEVILNPLEEVEIIHKVPVKIIYPLNNANNITGSSDFKISDDNSPGVFVYEFVLIENSGTSKYLRYFTTKKELKFSDITCRGFEKHPNCEYWWWVYKLPGFEDIDKLLAVHYLQDGRYNNVELSQNRIFFTGP